MLDKELEPECIRIVDLLLIALGVWVEEDDGGMLKVLWRLIVVLTRSTKLLHFLDSLHFLIVEGEEHAVQLHTILRLNIELSPIKILLKHVLQLII